MTSGMPSCTMFTSVPQETFFSVTVVCISPGRFGSSNAAVRHEFQILAAERMTMAGGEVGEGHLVGAADLGIHLMHFGGKTVGWQPPRPGVSVGECTVDFFGRRAQYAVKLDGIGRHEPISV